MNDTTLQDQLVAARAYEALFVPALFEQWAAKVADIAQIRPGQRVLDVACGTGVLSREVLSRVGPQGYVAGIDASPGMLAAGKEIEPLVDWKHGLAEALPFADESFDTVVSQFGLMFFTDRVQAIDEMLRVLMPGGRLVVAVWDSLESIPAYEALAALLDRLVGVHAGDALRAPFVLGDQELLASLFAGAAESRAAIATHQGTAQFPSVAAMVEAELRGWLPLLGVILEERQVALLMQEAEDVLRPYVNSEGRLVFAAPALLVFVAKVSV